MPLHRRLPKLKGFSNSRFKITYQVVNLHRLAALYPDGGDVTPEDLAARGAVRRGELVKILGTGEAVSGLRVTAHAFSASRPRRSRRLAVRRPRCRTGTAQVRDAPHGPRPRYHAGRLP